MIETLAVRRIVPFVFAAILAAAGLCAEEGKAATGKTLLQGLPRETFLLIHVRDARSAAAKAKKSPFYQLKDHPDVKPVIAQIVDEVKKNLASAEADLGFNPGEFLETVEGEVVVAIGSLDDLAGDLQQALSMGQEPKGKLDKFPLILAADFGGSAAKVKERLAKLFVAAEKKGAKRTTSSFRSGNITELARLQEGAGGEDEDKDEDEKDEKEGKAKKDGGEDDKEEDEDEKDEDEDDAAEEMKLFFGELGSHLFVSTSRKFLEESMGKFDKPEGEALLANDHFNETRKMLRGGDDVFAFINVGHLTATINKALSNTFFAFYWQKAESILFGKSLKNVGFSLLFEPQHLRSSAFVYNGGAADGLLGIFKSDAFAPVAPGFLPDGASSFSVTGFNAARIETMVREIAQIAAALGQPAADIDAMFEQQYGVKLKDVFAALGKKLYFFTQAADVNLDDPFGDVNVALEIKDEGPFKKLLQKAVETYSGKIETSKYKEKDLYTLAGAGDGFSVALSDKFLIGTSSPAKVKAVIDRAGSPGSKLGEEFQKHAALLPAQVVIVTYTKADYLQNYVRSMAGLLAKAAEDEEATKAIQSVAGAFAEQLGPAVGFGAWTGSGLQADSFYIYKK